MTCRGRRSSPGGGPLPASRRPTPCPAVTRAQVYRPVGGVRADQHCRCRRRRRGHVGAFAGVRRARLRGGPPQQVRATDVVPSLRHSHRQLPPLLPPLCTLGRTARRPSSSTTWLACTRLPWPRACTRRSSSSMRRQRRPRAPRPALPSPPGTLGCTSPRSRLGARGRPRRRRTPMRRRLLRLGANGRQGAPPLRRRRRAGARAPLRGRRSGRAAAGTAFLLDGWRSLPLMCQRYGMRQPLHALPPPQLGPCRSWASDPPEDKLVVPSRQVTVSGVRGLIVTLAH